MYSIYCNGDLQRGSYDYQEDAEVDLLDNGMMEDGETIIDQFRNTNGDLIVWTQTVDGQEREWRVA